MPEENKNPYDLVDKSDQEKNNNNPQKESWVFLKKLIKGIAKLAWLPDPETWKSAKDSLGSNTSNTVNESNTNTTLEQDVATQEEQKKQEEKKKFNFDSIMAWVSWVMDKIEKKVEEKTGIDFDAPLKKREENLNKENENNNWENESQTPLETTKTEEQTVTQTTTSTTVNESAPENEIEKNNEEYLKS